MGAQYPGDGRGDPSARVRGVVERLPRGVAPDAAGGARAAAGSAALVQRALGGCCAACVRRRSLMRSMLASISSACASSSRSNALDGMAAVAVRSLQRSVNERTLLQTVSYSLIGDLLAHCASGHSLLTSLDRRHLFAEHAVRPSPAHCCGGWRGRRQVRGLVQPMCALRPASAFARPTNSIAPRPDACVCLRQTRAARL